MPPAEIREMLHLRENIRFGIRRILFGIERWALLRVLHGLCASYTVQGLRGTCLGKESVQLWNILVRRVQEKEAKGEVNEPHK